MVLCDKQTTHSELTCGLGVTTIPSRTHTGITNEYDAVTTSSSRLLFPLRPVKIVAMCTGDRLSHRDNSIFLKLLVLR